VPPVVSHFLGLAARLADDTKSRNMLTSAPAAILTFPGPHLHEQKKNRANPTNSRHILRSAITPRTQFPRPCNTSSFDFELVKWAVCVATQFRRPEGEKQPEKRNENKTTKRFGQLTTKAIAILPGTEIR
jgi:hypothetical protein